MKPKLDESCLEFAFPVNIQSGGQYNLKIEAVNSSQKISADTVILTVCSKYKDITCNVSRTLLINPVNEQKEAYEFLTQLLS
jgi:nucleosome binding factor SPN SPT16 subunit